MAAFMWNANPERWDVVPPSTSSWDALKDYLLDPSNYVYWSTPVLRGQIRSGDRAFIWRTQSPRGANGIVAIGRVKERPRQLTSTTVASFTQPKRLPAAGWDEAKAPSSWKTGIQVDQIFWNAPLRVSFTAAQGTLRQLNEDEVHEAERQASVR